MKYKFTLFEALGRLIQDRNALARSKNGKEIIIGKNFSIENKYSADLPHLYHYWCLVCTTGDLSKDHGIGIPDDEIPCAFLMAGTSGKRELCLTHFARMKRTGADSPWMIFSGSQLLELLPTVIPTCDIGIPAACEMRDGHCCVPGACETYDQGLLHLLGEFENCMKAVTRGRQQVEFGRPQECRRILPKIEKDMENHLVKLRCILKTDKLKCNSNTLQASQKPTNLSKDEEELDESRKAQETDAKDHFSREQPDWEQQCSTHGKNTAQTLWFEYFFLIIVSAGRREEYAHIRVPRVPRGFQNLWGRSKLQEQLHVEHWELNVNKRRADMLARGGIAPPLLHNYVFSLLNRWAASDPTIVKDFQLHPGYRKAKAQRRKMSNEITNQIIAFLAIHLSKVSPYTDDLLLENVELCHDMAMPIKWDVSHALVLSRRQLNCSETTSISWNLLGSRRFLPLGIDPNISSIEEHSQSEQWIENVIQPIADRIFNEQPWRVSEDDSADEDTDHDVKALQKLMDCNTVLRFHKEGTKKKIRQFPKGFFVSSTEKQQKMANVLIQEEEKKRDGLVTLALSHILAEVGSYGTPAFRTPSSPVVVSAARKAFSEKGVKLFPFRGSPFCECEYAQDHLLLEIEILAHLICEKLSMMDDEMATRPLNKMSEILDPRWA